MLNSGLQTTESDLRRGKHITAGEETNHTLADAIDRYLNSFLCQYPHRIPKQRQLLSWWKDQIGSCSFQKFSPAVISQLRDRLVSEKTCRRRVRSGSTVNRYWQRYQKYSLCACANGAGLRYRRCRVSESSRNHPEKRGFCL